MPSVAPGLPILALAVRAAANIGDRRFAAATPLVNSVRDEPVVYLHGRITAEVDAGTTIRAAACPPSRTVDDARRRVREHDGRAT